MLGREARLQTLLAISHSLCLQGHRPEGRPADLGYWMGYRIARGYYRRAADKAQAIRDMLRIRDFDAFLEASGVAEEFAGR